MSDGVPTFALKDHVGLITLNDPASLNALNPKAWRTLIDILGEIEVLGDKVGAVVLTGAGRGFCAGANLTQSFEGAEGVSMREFSARTMKEDVDPVMIGLRSLPVPLVTAVNGVAAGVGVSLALSGDIVVAASSASFIVPFMPKLGMVPDGGLTWMLPRIVGRARAGAMMLLGDRLTAEQAERWGMVWQVVDDAALMSTAMAAAHRLAAGPPQAAREIRGCLNAADGNTFEQQLLYEAVRQGEMLETEAFREGLEAFLQKRPARFRSDAC